MAENWDLSAVVNSSFTPANNFGNANFSENANSDNPLEFLNHLTFGDDDDLYSFSELEPPKTTGFQELQDSSCEPFLVPTSIDNDALQGGGNILIPNPTASVPDFQLLAPQNHSPFLLQHYQQQNRHMIPANFPAINSPRRFIGGVRQQFRHIQQRPFLQPCQIQRPLLQWQAAPPILIPRLSSLPAAGTRSRKKKCNQKRRVEQVPADKINSDVWSWRKYGQKPIKGSPYPRNYYRCSSSKGCLARKQVEESNTDPDMFIVYFTGEHNHPRPTINHNSVAGSRYKFFGRTNILPLSKEYEIPPPAPSTSEKGSSCLSPVLLSATSLSPTTPLSASIDHADVGADTESHVGANTETGGVDTESHIATDSDEGGGGGSA